MKKNRAPPPVWWTQRLLLSCPVCCTRLFVDMPFETPCSCRLLLRHRVRVVSCLVPGPSPVVHPLRSLSERTSLAESRESIFKAGAAKKRPLVSRVTSGRWPNFASRSTNDLCDTMMRLRRTLSHILATSGVWGFDYFCVDRP